MQTPDPFERELARQPWKPLSPEWRAEILAAAKERPTRRAIAKSPLPGWASLGARLAAWFWPHPLAWGGLAAAWLLVFALHGLPAASSPTLVAKAAPISSEMVVALRQQRQLLAELIGPPEERLAERPREQAPKPRSARTGFAIA